MLYAGLLSKALIPAFDEGSDAHFSVDHSLPTHADWFAAGERRRVASVGAGAVLSQSSAP